MGKTPERDPRSYTPKHLAEKILTSRSALEGERKQVTVLFADVKGSMDLAKQVGPEARHKRSLAGTKGSYRLTRPVDDRAGLRGLDFPASPFSTLNAPL